MALKDIFGGDLVEDRQPDAKGHFWVAIGTDVEHCMQCMLGPHPDGSVSECSGPPSAGAVERAREAAIGTAVDALLNSAPLSEAEAEANRAAIQSQIDIILGTKVRVGDRVRVRGRDGVWPVRGIIVGEGRVMIEDIPGMSTGPYEVLERVT